MKAGGRLTVERRVELGRVSRSGFYRFDDGDPGPDPDMDLRDAIQKIAVEWPSYGRPRMTKELRERGWKVNPKRVHRLMREDNLLCVRKRKFVVTTDSHHTRKVYPNLARDIVLTAINQLWRGRYHLHPAARRVRLSGGDSGRVLAPRDRLGAGSHNGRLADAYRATHGAFAPRSSPAWCIIPTAARSTPARITRDLLRANDIEISMRRKGNPWDNAACESFMKTLKYEEVLRNEYRDLAGARASIREFLEKIYNQKRLHSALGYMPPARFEANQKDAAARQLSV